MEPDTILWITGVATAALSVILENASKKFKPWSWLAKQIGKAINAEVVTKIDGLDKKITALEDADKKQAEEYMRDKARAARRRIITFADEIRRHTKHSQENFDDVLADISCYNKYCRDHPNFPNEKALRSIETIRETYDQCCKDNDFL